MRTSLAIAIAVPLLLVMQMDGALAQNYPWCAQYGIRGGARNCGFVTYRQCMATIRGLGGYCEQNFMYRPPGDGRPVRRKRHWTHG
jgi:Protein of unknown function (DUF3551)